MKKKYDLAVKTGEYQSNGQTKGRWTTIGAMMEDDKGGNFVFLNRSFNPAGVPFKEGSESIMVSLFEPKSKDGSQSKQEPLPPVPDEIPY